MRLSFNSAGGSIVALLHKQLAMSRVGMPQRLGDREHGAARHRDTDELVGQGVGLVGGQQVFDLGLQRVAVGATVGVSTEARVFGQGGDAKMAAEFSELTIVSDREDYLALASPEGVVGRDVRVGDVRQSGDEFALD